MSTLSGRRSIATMDAAFGGLAAIRFEPDQRRHSDRKDRGEGGRGGHCSGPRRCPSLRECALRESGVRQRDVDDRALAFHLHLQAALFEDSQHGEVAS